MSEYNCFIQTVIECFAEYDERKDITLVPNLGAMNTSTGAFEPSFGTPVILSGLTVPMNKQLFNDTTLQTDDILLFIDNAYEPTPDDKVTLDSQEYSIAQIEKVAPGGPVILYKVLLRK